MGSAESTVRESVVDSRLGSAESDEQENLSKSQRKAPKAPHVPILRSLSHHQVKRGEEEEDELDDLFDGEGAFFDFDDDDTDEKLGTLVTRKPDEHYVAMRRQTLETYRQLVDEDAQGSRPGQKKFQTLAKQRSKNLTSRKGFKKHLTVQDLRARSAKDLGESLTLKNAFFRTVQRMYVPGALKKKNKKDRALLLNYSNYNRPWIEQIEEDDTAIAAEFKYDKIERDLNDEIKKAQEKQTAQEDATKLKADVEKIRALRKKMRDAQYNKISKARTEAVRLEKEIKAKIKELEVAKSGKNKEAYHLTTAAIISDEVESKRAKKKWGIFSGHTKKRKKKMIVSPIQAAEEEREFKEQMEALEADLISLREALTLMQLEKVFPQSMRWKMRVDCGGGLYIGMRDVEIEKLNAHFEIESGGEPGLIRMRVHDLFAILGILEFVFAGKSYLAKFLGGVFTPTVNRLDLVCRGQWELWLRYNTEKSIWVEDTHRSKFNLDIEKKVTGITTIRLPAWFVKILANTIFPKLISAALIEAFPSHLATFQHEGYVSEGIPYLAQKGTHIDIQGTFDITGDMSPNVWRCPIYGPTKEAIAARKALGVETELTLEEAIMLDFMLKSPRAIAAGFSKKPVTMARLYKWRLQYATYDLADLVPLFNYIQQGSKEALPHGYFAHFMHRVEELALKPVTLDIELNSVNTNIDLIEVTTTSLQMYLFNKEKAVEQAGSAKAKAVATTELETFKSQIASTLASLEFVRNILNKEITADISTYIVGGEDGFLALEIHGLEGVGRVPAKFELPTVIPSQEEDIPIEVHGKDGPGEGEYTVSVFDPMRGGDMDQENGTFITLSDVSLELLPKDLSAGAVRLKAAQLRASAFFPSLDDILTFLTVGQESTQEKRKKKVDFQSPNAAVRHLVFQTQAVVSRLKSFVPSDSTAFMITEEDINPYSSLPDFLIFNRHKFLTEIRGLKVTVRKEGDMMRLCVTYNLQKDPTADSIKLKMRHNLANVFEVI